jgi:hypothetical protein
MRFFDASALVKRYVRERGTAAVARLLRAGPVAVSRLSEVEVTSALARLSRDAGLSPVRRDAAIAALVADLDAWHVVELTPEIASRARRLLTRHRLRTGDAIQLASGLYLQEAMGRTLEGFVSYDARLSAAGRAEHLLVEGPGAPPAEPVDAGREPATLGRFRP